jgi:hypothetical protein
LKQLPVKLNPFMPIRFFLLWMLLSNSALAQFQAQNGWGLPRKIAETTITQGIVLDVLGNRIIAADQNGLVAKPLSGGAGNGLFTQSGIRNLVGTGGGRDLALAWYSRSLTDSNAVWGWYRGQAKKLAETEVSSVAIGVLNGQPAIAYIVTEGDATVIYLHPWNAPRVAVHRTKLNVGALALGITTNGLIGVLFAEGYRNAQDEKYDAIFVTGTLKAGFKSKRLGAAVYTGREARYAIAIRSGDQLFPVWWFESDEEQRTAAFTKTHNPRLAVWNVDRVMEFAAAGDPLGSTGEAFYFKQGTDILAFDLKTGDVTREMIAPLAIVTAAVSSVAGTRYAAWQSLKSDGFASEIWLADSRQAYAPTTMDRISLAFGWNPWYPAQSALGQTLLSLLLAAGAVMLSAPFVWLLSTQFRVNLAPWIAVLIGAGIVAIFRAISGFIKAPGWGFEPLLTAPWWAALIGVLIGAGLVWLTRKRFGNSELAPTVASSLTVLLGVFVMVFSRAGFIHF